MDNIIYIESRRLILVPPKIETLQRKLKEEEFKENYLISNKVKIINFPKDWAETSKVIFPMEIERIKNDSEILPFWLYLIIDRESKTVIGDIGCKTKPDSDNEIEIGYGINPSTQKNGYATEAVATLIDYLFNNTDIASIKAECNIENIPSIRVLEKNSFKKFGIRFDDEDGDLIIWKKERNL